MNDERKLLDIDSRVRTALQASDEACRRLVAHALAGPPGISTRRRRIGLAAAASAALAGLVVLVVVLVFVLAGFEWRHSAVPSMSRSLSVTSAGSLLIVESEDGRRWIVSHWEPRRSGNYVLVITE
jgi:hypothetical protein